MGESGDGVPLLEQKPSDSFAYIAACAKDRYVHEIMIPYHHLQLLGAQIQIILNDLAEISYIFLLE